MIPREVGLRSSFGILACRFREPTRASVKSIFPSECEHRTCFERSAKAKRSCQSKSQKSDAQKNNGPIPPSARDSSLPRCAQPSPARNRREYDRSKFASSDRRQRIRGRMSPSGRCSIPGPGIIGSGSRTRAAALQGRETTVGGTSRPAWSAPPGRLNAESEVVRRANPAIQRPVPPRRLLSSVPDGSLRPPSSPFPGCSPHDIPHRN